VKPAITVRSADAVPTDDGRAVALEIGVVERRFGDESVFFLVNTSNVGRRLRIGVGAPGRVVEWWDPVEEHKVTLIGDVDGAILVTLAPYQSRFLAITTRAGQPGWKSAIDEEVTSVGQTRVLGPWTVKAAGESWQEAGEVLRGWDQRETTRYFSGVGTYETTVTLSPADLQGKQVWLDFGEGMRVEEYPRRNGFRAWLDGPIREAASIDVNGGKVVGSIWAPPYRMDVTVGLKPGENSIRIRVGNTAMNHMAGEAPPSHRLLTLRYGERFVPQDMDQVTALPSGLTAPVRMVIGNLR
jgi:hypothetical protein